MQLFNENDLTQPSRLTGNSARLLVALADLGCGKHVLAALLSLDDAHPDHIRFLTGPVVQHASPWAETTPRWLYEAVTADRLRIILAERERGEIGWQVGPAELTAVMYPATMDAPCPSNTPIFIYGPLRRPMPATPARLLLKSGPAIGEPVQDRQIVDPSGRYHHAYKQLCSDIRRRVIKAAGAASRAEKKPAQQPAVITEQLPLF